MADARGIALILRLGIFRGADTLRPRPQGSPVEEVAFGLATQTGKDGNKGEQYWALDFEYQFVQSTGQIGIIVSVPELLAAGIALMKTPLGSFVITRGGCPPEVIVAVMIYDTLGTYEANTVVRARGMQRKAFPTGKRNKMIGDLALGLVIDPEEPSADNSTNRYAKAYTDHTTMAGIIAIGTDALL
eukprot:10611978-Heterocapsa_arctica.AAC.1